MLERCSSCKIVSELEQCEVCRYLFCPSCHVNHANEIALKYPPASEEALNCFLHGVTSKYFCQEISCMQFICVRCKEENHNGHKFCDLAVKAHVSRDCFLSFKETHLKKMLDVSKIISRLEKEKINFEVDAYELKREIEQRHEDLLTFVNNTFNDQIEQFNQERKEILNELSKELRSLESFQEEIKNSVQLISHFRKDADDPMVLKCYEKMHEICNLKETERHFFEIKSLSIDGKYSNRKGFYRLQSNIRDYAGQVLTSGNDFFYDNVRAANITNFVYDPANDRVKDICYDIDLGYLFLLITKMGNFYIRTFYEDNFLRETILNYNEPKLMSVFSDQTILLLHESKLDVISLGWTQYHSLPSAIRELNNVLTMCSSPCLTCIYIFCSSGDLFKYYHNGNNYDRISFKLDWHPTRMSVSESLEHIVFTGDQSTFIYVYSYEGTMRYKLGVHDSEYRQTFFIQNSILVAFNESKKSLDVFNIADRKFLKKINTLKFQGREQELECVYAMAKCSSISAYVVEFSHFYKIEFLV